MNHFVSWEFFPVGGLNSLGQPNSARRANFQELENETCPGIFLLDSRKWLEFLGLFARSVLSIHQLWRAAAMKLPKIPATLKDPANPSIFAHKFPQPPKKLKKIPRNFQPKNRVEKLP
jgi:hypothetical protein